MGSENSKIGLEVSEWMEYIEKNDFCLTKKDITYMNAGQQVKLFLLDPTSLELAKNVNKSCIVMKPRKFFKKSCILFKKGKQDSVGIMKWYSGGKGDFFEFEIEHKGKWHPLQNGYLQLKNTSYENALHLEKLSDNTRIGWKGPMVSLSKIKQLPDIYWCGNNNV